MAFDNRCDPYCTGKDSLCGMKRSLTERVDVQKEKNTTSKDNNSSSNYTCMGLRLLSNELVEFVEFAKLFFLIDFFHWRRGIEVYIVPAQLLHPGP
jgi:hypothetical protein